MKQKVSAIFQELEKLGVPLYFSLCKYLDYKDDFENKKQEIIEEYKKFIGAMTNK